MQVDETTIAMTFAVLGVLFSIAWVALGLYGIHSIRDLADAVRSDANDEP